MADTIEIDVLLNMRDNTSAGIGTAKSNIDKFTQSVDKAKDKVDKLGGTNAKPSVSLVDRASSTLNKITSGIKGFAGKTFRASVKVIDYATRPLRAIKNTLFSIKSLVLAVGAGLVGKKLISDPISLADQYSSAKIGFSTLLGDKKGQKMMDDIDKFAKETPFKTSNTTAQAQRLVAMGWDAKNIIKDMKTIGDAAAATGKGDEGLNRIALALSQIKSKGKLSTEELNQLAEAGISAKRYIAEGLGYGSGDEGMAKMAKDLEKGAIGSEEALSAILKGMKEYKGMMNKTANETVEGLKSQIEDTFEINIFRRWGQGLQDGAKRGLGSIAKFLDKNEGRLKNFGNTLNKIGKELSSWAADKIENTLDKVMKLVNDPAFKKASLFGKVKIAWDELIAKPFGEWWDSTGYPFVMDKVEKLGKGIGEGISGIFKGFAGLFGGDSEVLGDAKSIGGSFAKGFTEGFDAKGIMKSIGSIFKNGFKTLFNGSWLSKILLGVLSVKLAKGVLNGLTLARSLWLGSSGVGAAGVSGVAGAGASGIGYVGGLKGFLGGASTASGVLEGSGLIGGLAKIGSAATGHGGLLGIVPHTGGGLALSGLGTVAGTVVGGVGAYKGAKDLYSGYTADNSNDAKHYKTRGYTKLGMVGAGAAIGTAIAPGIGTAIGAGLGGLSSMLFGNKLADKISGVSKSTKELRQEAEKLKDVNMAKHFGDVKLTSEQLQRKVKDIIGTDTITRVNRFTESMQNLANAETNLSSQSDSIAYFNERIMGGEKLSKSDIEEYQTALTGYTDSLREYLKLDKTNARSAFQLLYGDDTKGLQKMTKSMNTQYTKLEKDLDKKTNKLNKIMAKAFKDGKLTKIEEKEIAKVLNQIDDIDDKIKNKTEEAEKNARYDLIKNKYSTISLTAESYKALVNELNAQNEIDMKAYDDAYVTAKAKIDVQFEDGTINKKTYEKKLKEIEDKWFNGKTETLKKTYDVTFDIVKTNYRSEFAGIKKALEGDIIENGAMDLFNNDIKMGMRYGEMEKIWDESTDIAVNDLQDKFLKSAGIDEKMQVQMEELYNAMKPQEKELKALKAEYEKAGKQIPQWINDGLSNIENIKLMSGDKGLFQKMLGKQLAEDNAAAAETLLSNGKNLPKSFKKGLEEGLKEQGTIDMSTNLKLTADKQKIDTSKMDKATADAVEKMQSKGILKITKDGKVTVKTKDRKIDTTGLDKETKAIIDKLPYMKINREGKLVFDIDDKPDATVIKKLDDAASNAAKALEDKGLINIERDGKVTINQKGGIDYDDVDKKTKSQLKQLEKDGVIKINKDGKVKIVAKAVETKSLEKSAQKAALSLEDKGLLKINKKGEVNITAKGGINYNDVDKKTKAQLKKLEESGVIKIKKNGEVQVVANVKTKSAEQLASKKAKAALAKKEKVKKNTDVLVTSKTFTKGAVTSTKNAIDNAFANPFGVSAILNAHIVPQTPYPTLASNSYGSLKNSVTSKFSNPFSATAILNAKVSPSVPFSTLASNSFSSFKTSFTSKFSSGFSITAPYSVTPSKSGGGSKKKVGPVRKDNEGQQANGGFSHGPQRILWGEDGPEVIIPLSSKRRQRGLDLFHKTAGILGVRGYANGGFSDGTESGGSSFRKYFSNDNSNNTESSHKTGRKVTGTVEVNVGGITIEVSSSGDGAASDIMRSKDAICNTIAEALQEAFQNLPLATE